MGRDIGVVGIMKKNKNAPKGVAAVKRQAVL
jgi:hypothetical protein